MGRPPLLEEFPKEAKGMQDEVWKPLSFYDPGRVTLSLALMVIGEEESQWKLCGHSASISGGNLSSGLPKTH